ncbi:DUF4065 domain-containing protein [Flavobacterium sp. CBA20B-1]|uniref:Panacea domain-containing protein n=1 Tax=unclassified Flavobacterium TaxID=196869 RepID=UPI00222425DD|nr:MULTISPECIES: type II toxin-antitoxin system antitoxin SocA domain-containing protein [unclassified Flavobacterium]WCM42459.1 DUF4065 domain-containing protein [Flavobacterium sp. CBA20B-1]
MFNLTTNYIMYNANLIAQYFINKYGSSGNITPMKLIKLVYIAHGWCLGLTGKPLITETPEAWKYGPVIPSIYAKFKSYRNNPILPLEISTDNLNIGNTDKEFLDKIWLTYGKETGTQLSNRTHQPNTPWSIIWNKLENGEMKYSFQIPNDLIKEHYRRIVEGNKMSKVSN